MEIKINKTNLKDELKTIYIEKIQLYNDFVVFNYSLNKDFNFQTRIYYPDDIISKLISIYNEEELNFLFSNMALFESLKFMMIFPDVLDVTSIEKYLSLQSINYLEENIQNLYSQHIYENRNYGWKYPKIIYNAIGNCKPLSIKFKEININESKRPVLVSNGGGKDSFLSMKLLIDGDINFSIFTHARSEYGRYDIQFKYQDRLQNYVAKTYNLNDCKNHKIIVHDDFTDGVYSTFNFKNLKGECINGKPCQVGFPEMIIDSLPFVLLFGYSHFILGNERSANASQVKNISELETVNHQFLKSFKSEKSLDSLLKFLIKDFGVFSILRPVYDLRIYENISKYPEILPYVHSCNVHKPWCSDCSKCAYVFCHFCSIYDFNLVIAQFKENLFDKENLEIYWKQLLGLSNQNAFECVGEIDECRIAMNECLNKGLKGKAIDIFKENNLDKINYKEIKLKYNEPIFEDILIPEDILSKIKKYY